MIVQDIMTTKLVSVDPDDSLSHAANLLRQHQFHHLPVARSVQVKSSESKEYTVRRTILFLEGILTTQDIEMAIALAHQDSSSEVLHQLWQERRVSEIMHPVAITVSATASVGGAAQLLIERGLDYLPVVEYDQSGEDSKTMLLGLLTRSDIVLAMARAMGTFEPGTDLDITLPMGDMTPLTEALQIATKLHVRVCSVIAAPLTEGIPHKATLRVGTINPAPLLRHLRAAGIVYSGADPAAEGEAYA